VNQRFNFSDITIYQKVGEVYLNLTDFAFQEESETIQITSDSKYLLVYENFLNYKKSKKEPIPYSELTAEQLQAIAGFTSSENKSRIKSKAKCSKYFGLLCAETILNTNYSKRVVITNDDTTAEIQQKKKIVVDGKTIQPMVTVVQLEIKHGLVTYIE
jgi:hypothetical protein